VIPYYVFKTRGVKGFVAPAILVGIAVLARAGVAILYAVMTVARQ
jgi:hypothetical protein